MIPKTNKPHIGLEFEFASKIDDFELFHLFNKENLCKYIDVDFDDSIDTTEKYPHNLEVQCCIPLSKYRTVLPKILTILNQIGKVNSSCGFHVHLDTRDRNKEKIYNNLRKTQTILFDMNPANRYRSRHPYAKRFPAKIIDYNAAYSYQSESDPYIGDKYFGINLISEYDTIEVRIHSGTINLEKVMNWIQLLIKIARVKRIKKEISKPIELCKILKLDKKMLNYIKSRIAKFHKDGKHISVKESD